MQIICVVFFNNLTTPASVIPWKQTYSYQHIHSYPYVWRTQLPSTFTNSKTNDKKMPIIYQKLTLEYTQQHAIFFSVYLERNSQRGWESRSKGNERGLS